MKDIPIELEKLKDNIFEFLPNDLAKTWPERFLSSINIGSDLELVFPKFIVWLLGDPEYGVIKYGSEKSKISIQRVIDLYLKKINGEEVSPADWALAREAAAAAFAAAYTSAYTSSADAAFAAAYAAAYAYASAAAYISAYAAAADAAAADAASYAASVMIRKQIRIIQSEKLLELLRETI